MNSTPKKLKVTDLNPFLICVLCKGYYIDATTIVECLHSFCKTCIVKYLKRHKYCPICDVLVYKTKPLSNIRPDQRLQNAVYKLIPGLYEREMQRRKLFFSQVPAESTLGLSGEERGIITESSEIILPDENISITLEYLAQSAEDVNKAIYGRRYLRCKASAPVSILHKFLRNKFNLSNKHCVELVCNNEILAGSMSVVDVAYIYQWKKKTPMFLGYRILETKIKRLSEVQDIESSKRLKLNEDNVPESININVPNDKNVEEENKTEATASVEKINATNNDTKSLSQSNSIANCQPVTSNVVNSVSSSIVANSQSSNEWKEVELKINDNGEMKATPITSLPSSVLTNSIVPSNLSLTNSCMSPSNLSKSNRTVSTSRSQSQNSNSSHLLNLTTTPYSIAVTSQPPVSHVLSTSATQLTDFLVNNTSFANLMPKISCAEARSSKSELTVTPLTVNSSLGNVNSSLGNVNSSIGKSNSLTASSYSLGTSTVNTSSTGTNYTTSHNPVVSNRALVYPMVHEPRATTHTTFTNPSMKLPAYTPRASRPRGPQPRYKTLKTGVQPWNPTVSRSKVTIGNCDPLKPQENISKIFKSRNNPRYNSPSPPSAPIRPTHSALTKIDPRTLSPIVSTNSSSVKSDSPTYISTPSPPSSHLPDKHKYPRPNPFLHPSLFYPGFLPYTPDTNPLLPNTPDFMKAMSALYQQQQNPAFHASLPPSISTLFNHHLPSSSNDKKSSLSNTTPRSSSTPVTSLSSNHISSLSVSPTTSTHHLSPSLKSYIPLNSISNSKASAVKSSFSSKDRSPTSVNSIFSPVNMITSKSYSTQQPLSLVTTTTSSTSLHPVANDTSKEKTGPKVSPVVSTCHTNTTTTTTRTNSNNTTSKLSETVSTSSKTETKAVENPVSDAKTTEISTNKNDSKVDPTEVTKTNVLTNGENNNHLKSATSVASS